jgi:hypothetical protein
MGPANFADCVLPPNEHLHFITRAVAAGLPHCTDENAT